MKKIPRYQNTPPKDRKTDPDFPDYSWCQDGKCWSEARQVVADDPRFGEVVKWIGGHFLHSHKNSNGYMATTLTKDGRYHHVFIHARMARTYLGKTPSGKQISHENHSKEDNSLKNLKFRTAKSNTQKSLHDNGSGQRGKGVRLTPAERELIKELKAMQVTIVALSKQFKHSELCIRKVLGYKYIPKEKK